MSTKATGANAQFTFTRYWGEGVEVLYSYALTDPYLVPLTVAYTYSDETASTDRVIGCRAAATQKIMNNLPMWMHMRQKHDSVGQVLAHAWGCNLEDANSLFNEYRSEQFLATANTYDDVHMGVSELSFSEEKVYDSDFRNILFNSSFSMTGPARLQRPEGWAVSRNALADVSFDKTNSVFGDHGVAITGSMEMKQLREYKMLGGHLTYSIYVKTTSDTGEKLTDKYDPDEAGLIMAVHYADSTVDSFGIGFPKNTANNWARVGLTATITKETHKVEVMVVNRTGVNMVVDLPMLEQTKGIQAWSPSPLDTPIYLNASVKDVTGVQVLKNTLDEISTEKVEVLEVGSEGNFRDVVIPTRIEPFSPKTAPKNSVSQHYGRQITANGETMPVMWTVADNQISEESLTTPDNFVKVIPRDLTMDGSGNLILDTSLTLETDLWVLATTVVGHLLYVVTKETYAGKTARYLKVVKTDKVLYEDTFLESLADLEIPIEIGTFGPEAATEEINRVGTCKALPGVIFIDTTLDRRFYFKLRFDYYYADFGTRKLFCRENYLTENANLQVI